MAAAKKAAAAKEEAAAKKEAATTEEAADVAVARRKIAELEAKISALEHVLLETVAKVDLDVALPRTFPCTSNSFVCKWCTVCISVLTVFLRIVKQNLRR